MIKEKLRFTYFINSRVIFSYRLQVRNYIYYCTQIIKKIMIMILHNSEFNTFITPTI